MDLQGTAFAEEDFRIIRSQMRASYNQSNGRTPDPANWFVATPHDYRVVWPCCLLFATDTGGRSPTYHGEVAAKIPIDEHEDEPPELMLDEVDDDSFIVVNRLLQLVGIPVGISPLRLPVPDNSEPSLHDDAPFRLGGTMGTV